jgi:histidyl-tRNA synthetase
MHKNDITFPFKRYQIQPVWRADRPQKGRYREFYQCDADIIGSDSLLNEYELILVIDEVFSKLGLKVLIQINNRKILSGVAELMQMPERIIDLTVAIDKLDKIGVEKVEEELSNKGFSNEALNKLRPLFNLHGSNNDKLNSLESLLSTSEVGLLGIAEVRRMLSFVSNSELNSCKLELEITLARGLNYYTGAIFEVKVADERSSFTSSICGGGRYDDLTGIFGLPNMSGVGISFGADRIYDVLEEAKLFKDDAFVSTKVLVINFGGDDLSYALKITSLLRGAGVNTELYPDDAKIKKQMGYADSLAIPFVIIAGSDERNANEVTIKDMRKGEQVIIAFAELVNYLKNN